jgi:polyhydroxyalkanoate synthase
MKGLPALGKRLTRPRPPVGTTPADVVHRENKWRLLRYRARAGGPAFATPVLLVPSLINRHYVLDLLPGKSFAEYLVAEGHDVFAIDWGTPEDEDRFVSFDDVCDTYLGRAVRVASSLAPRGKAHLLGYCLGGTLAAIYAAARPERVASLVALAAPVRFDDGGLLSTWTRTPTFDLDALVRAFGNVPWQLMQSAFHLLRPTLSLSKAVHVLDRAWDDESMDGFLALETWGSDNVSFPGECYRRYVEELYRGDALVRGTFTLSGRPARLEAIRCPTLAVTFEHDGIVPWPSAAELVERVSSTDKERIHLPGGHVGAVVSKSAARSLWPRLSGWWRARDGEAGEAAAATSWGGEAGASAEAPNGVASAPANGARSERSRRRAARK